MPAKKVQTPKPEGTETSKTVDKKKSKRVETWKTYNRAILDQIDPELGFNGKSLNVINSMIDGLS